MAVADRIVRTPTTLVIDSNLFFPSRARPSRAATSATYSRARYGHRFAISHIRETLPGHFLAEVKMKFKKRDDVYFLAPR